MPWTLDIDTVHRLAYVRMTDVATFHDIAATQDALRDHPDFDPSFPFLLDARGAKVQLSQEDMLSIAERTPLAPKTKVAIVVDDPTELARVRDYEFIRELGVESDVTCACRTVDEALAWLGIADWRPTGDRHPGAIAPGLTRG
jgi:hypothetical protein